MLVQLVPCHHIQKKYNENQHEREKPGSIYKQGILNREKTVKGGLNGACEEVLTCCHNV